MKERKDLLQNPDFEKNSRFRTLIQFFQRKRGLQEPRKTGLFTMTLVFSALRESLKMAHPRAQIKNPVMFVTYVAALFLGVYVAVKLWQGCCTAFDVQITFWIALTVLFANFAQALSESRGRAQAQFLKRTKTETSVHILVNGKEYVTDAAAIKKGDVIICRAQDIIPADGEVIEGIATVDESAITGESAPVIRESGGDRSAVTAGTRVTSDSIKIRVTSDEGDSFLDRMIGLIEGAKRQKTPNELALNIVLSGLSILFLLTVGSLKVFSDYGVQFCSTEEQHHLSDLVTLPILVSLLICLIPTTISALLSAVGIAGMDRLIQRNVIAKSGRAVEAAGDVDVLLLDKTGTITMGNRMCTALLPIEGVTEEELARLAQLASVSDETPEGRSIVIFAKEKFDLRAETLHDRILHLVPFSAKTRMSGVDIAVPHGKVERIIRKGSKEAIKAHVETLGGVYPKEVDTIVYAIATSGGTPLLVCDNERILGVIHLKDVVKGGIRERFEEMRKMGIKTIMITGDNPLTAAAIAAEASVDDYEAEATPEIKLEIIKQKQMEGHLVAMIGDGTNDAPALAQADIGVAMNTGTQASREAGNMIDLDSNPTKLLEVVKIGKQLLMTRGALTTFSIANDIAKYFAILPAIFGTLYCDPTTQMGPLSVFNVMQLHSRESAILSAVIFNALIIIGLIPLALRGVRYNAESAYVLLRRNALIYGLGGIVTPFIGIKCIDYVIVTMGLG